MRPGLLVVGSELLTGKRRDAHLPHCIEALAERGLELDWCRYLADEPALLTRELRFTMSGDELVERFPDARLSCLPHMEGDYRETELGLRGETAAVDSALEWLVRELDRGGWTWERKR